MASWPMLQNLSATHINLTAEGLHAMANASWPLLLNLDLSMNILTGMLSYLKGAKWPKLRSLTLDECGLACKDIIDLVQLPLPSLRHLSLKHNSIGLAGAIEFASGSWPLLSIIDLKNN